MNFGKTIQTIRMKRGLSLKELAVKMGIEEAQLADIEANSNKPVLNIIVKLENALGIQAFAIELMALEIKDISPEKRKSFSLLEEDLKKLVMKIYEEDEYRL